MTDLTDEDLAPGVVVRRAPGTDLVIRPGADGQPAVVGVAQGAVWARAEAGSAGVDLGHGSVNVVLRSGTVLFDAHSGSGLLIVLRGQVEIASAHGATTARAQVGEALTFDGNGEVSSPDPVDAAELAQDAFVSLNLVLDAIAGVPLRLGEPEPGPDEPVAADAPADDARRGRSIFGGRRR